MDRPRLPQLQTRLASERAATIVRIADLTRDFDGIVEASTTANTDDEHDPEGATLGFERAQVAALLDQARSRLVELDEAVTRLGAGTYGACARCGQPIAVERLLARPSATTCVSCAAV